jgi:hypothetical protein
VNASEIKQNYDENIIVERQIDKLKVYLEIRGWG